MTYLNRMSLLASLLLFLVVASAQTANAQMWEVDKNHSAVTFKVKHFFTPVNGKFNDYAIELNFNPENLEESSINAEIQVASIDTDNAKRDSDLRSDSFFDAETFPTITFKSNAIKSLGENQYVASGKLKIKDVEKDVELPFTLLGTAEMRGRTVGSFQSNTSIMRNDYGVGTGNWVATTVVADEVQVEILLETRQ